MVHTTPGTELLSKCIASAGTSPQNSVPFGSTLALMVAVALKYFSIKFSYPPMSSWRKAKIFFFQKSLTLSGVGRKRPPYGSGCNLVGMVNG